MKFSITSLRISSDEVGPTDWLLKMSTLDGVWVELRITDAERKNFIKALGGNLRKADL